MPPFVVSPHRCLLESACVLLSRLISIGVWPDLWQEHEDHEGQDRSQDGRGFPAQAHGLLLEDRPGEEKPNACDEPLQHTAQKGRCPFL